MLSRFYAVIMGPPGSGKGTISERIAAAFKLKHISSGDLLRSKTLLNTDEGNKIKTYIDNGQYVPDDLITEIILKELQSIKKFNWLLDGFPRTVPQAEALDEHFQLSCLINLNVPDEEIINRLKDRWIHTPSGRLYHTKFSPPKVPGVDDITGEPLVQRDDDKPETVKARLNLYAEKSAPILEYYRKKNVLKDFYGTESNKIWPMVEKYLMDFNIST